MWQEVCAVLMKKRQASDIERTHIEKQGDGDSIIQKTMEKHGTMLPEGSTVSIHEPVGLFIQLFRRAERQIR